MAETHAIMMMRSHYDPPGENTHLRAVDLTLHGDAGLLIQDLRDGYNVTIWKMPPEDKRCDWCEGIGKVQVPCPAAHHNHKVTVACGRCEGTGWPRIRLFKFGEILEECDGSIY